MTTTPLLCGYSILHRYLALAWALQGDFNQAEKIIKRASLLPDLHKQNISDAVSQIIINLLKNMCPIDAEIPVQEEVHDPVKTLVEMVKIQPLDLGLAKKFIDEATASLKLDFQQVPVVYFGVKNLCSRLAVTSHDDFERTYRPLFNSLFELITVLIDICYESNHIDPWLSKISKKIVREDHYSYLIKFPELNFSDQKRETPCFKFLDDLELASESMHSISACVTKEVYDLILGIMTAHLIRLNALEKIPLPESPTTFIGMLQSGFISDDKELFHNAAIYLKKYLALSIENQPFPIDHETLEWAKFCVFSMELPAGSADILENSYYPKNFSINSILELTWSVPKLFLSAHSTAPSILKQSLRDSFMADYELANRTIDNPIYIPLNNNLYAFFKISQQLFGCRYNESFANWGKRLQDLEINGPSASDLDIMEREDTNTQLPVIEGLLNAKTRGVLHVFLQFWIEFHKKTEEKNIFISQGGDEDLSECRDWFKNINRGNCFQMINNNKPQNYPGYKKLSLGEQKALTELVKNKHLHVEEVQKLREICAKPGYLKTEDFIKMMAAALITNTEYPRAEAHHSLFLENEAQAFQFYQLLLEISAERLIRSTLINAGIGGWTNLNEVSNILLPALNQLTGAFHGPETHYSGNGPIQPHYNAGIVTSKLDLQNVHIYFDDLGKK